LLNLFQLITSLVHKIVVSFQFSPKYENLSLKYMKNDHVQGQTLGEYETPILTN